MIEIEVKIHMIGIERGIEIEIEIEIKKEAEIEREIEIRKRKEKEKDKEKEKEKEKKKGKEKEREIKTKGEATIATIMKKIKRKKEIKTEMIEKENSLRIFFFLFVIAIMN
jgi:hypothetical protein